MKSRPVAQTIGLINLLVLILTLAYGLTWADGVIPTNEWVNFFSANTTFLGQPVPAGAVIAAFDPQGVRCGATPVTTPGKYGLMPCYRDEKPPSPTPDTVDEGANLGDAISFTINGIPATPVPVTLNGTPAPPSTTVIWTSFSDRWEVDLHVVAPPPPPVPVGGYTVPVNRLEILMPWLGLVTLPSRC